MNAFTLEETGSNKVLKWFRNYSVANLIIISHHRLRVLTKWFVTILKFESIANYHNNCFNYC